MKVRKIDNTSFPYMVEFGSGYQMNHWVIAYEWCNETFGEPFKPDLHSNVMDDKKWIKQWNGIRFKSEEYANWFILRFSGEL